MPEEEKIGETSALVLWWQPNFQWACSMSPEKQREKTRTLIVHKGGVSAHHNHHWYRFVVLIISSTSVWIPINAISDPKIHQDRDPFHVINFVFSIEIVDRYKKYAWIWIRFFIRIQKYWSDTHVYPPFLDSTVPVGTLWIPYRTFI